MKAYFKKIAALTAAALLVLSMAACGGNDDEDTTGTDTANSNAVVEDMPADDTNVSEDASASEDDSAASEDASEASNSADSAKDSSAASSNSSTLSKDEAVALFNKATASAKSMKGNRYTGVVINKLPGSLDKLKGMISEGLPSADEATPITGVPNTTMQASDFSSVTAKKSGNNWVLTMNVKTETAPNNAANARAFEELPQSEIDSWLDKFSVKPTSGMKFVYSGGTISATVTADGKLVSATYTMKVTLDVSDVTAMGLFKISSANISITQTDKF